jgi:alpha-mannosidase
MFRRLITGLGLTLLLLASAGWAQNAATAAEPPDPYKPALDRLESLTTMPVPEWPFHADMAHPEDPSVDTSGWETMKTGDLWKTGSRLLRLWITIPEKLNGYSVQGARVTLNLIFWCDGTAQITTYSNGSMVFRGSDDQQVPIRLTENAQPGQKFLIAVRLDVPENTPTSLHESQLTFDAPASRPDPALLRMEIVSARPLVAAYAEGKAEREREIDAAIKAIDFTALDRGDQNAFDASLQQARTKLRALDPWLKRFTIRAVGNSHIDMAWLWPWSETVEVVRNTFQSALDLMREYPDFKFTMSSARTYEWMEEKYPDMFQEIQKRAKEGRWEVVGGMWVEPDLNMPAGESLVRQILVGKRYFQKKFGVDVKIGWNPDSFGYNWQLPQIYKKSGMDYFVTQKLLWAHEFTTFPYKLFYWEAPDGSRLLTYFPHDYAGSIDGPAMAKDLSIWMPSIYGDETGDPQMMHLYGVGDHGGGPTRNMLDTANRLMANDIVYPKVEFSTAKDFFSDLEKKLPNMKVPVWKDELYFQYHRGVMTTQSETKRRIRRSEELLLNAEKFSSLAMLYGRPYPADEFSLAWRNLLFDHFHDIMPGSGIAVNYLEAKRNLEDVGRAGREMMNGAFDEILAHVNTQGAGVPIVVFNSLSWPRTELIETEAQLPSTVRYVEVVDAAGKPVKSHLLSMDAQTHRARILFSAGVPALGYKVYFVRPALKPAAELAGVKASADGLENEFLRLKIDTHTGCITSLFDKRSNTEALAPAETDTGGPKDFACGNLLQTFSDKPKRWDAWNIDADFEKQHWDLNQADEVKLVENQPLRAIIRVKKHFQNSTFVQDITIYAGVPRVDVKTQADWHEKHILLKVAFPLSAHNEKATFEIPYGSIERPTTRRTPAEQAEFEVPALQWADISDHDHGFSLLNDCKYGYDAKGNVLRLSLLRSPEWPDPHADEGAHEFTYSLYPHGGNWRDAQTIRRGYELNYKLMAMPTAKHEGALPAEHSFVEVQADNVVLTAVKKAEDDDAMVLRFYEWAGHDNDVKLQLPAKVELAWETDLMERPIGNLSVAQGAVTVPTKPYEIKTVKIRFAGESSAAASAPSGAPARQHSSARSSARRPH